MMKFNSLPKEDQAKEIRSLMRLFSKIETIIDLDEDDIVENFNTDVACTAEMILAHQKNIRKQIKHFTKLFNEEVTPLMSKLDYEDYLKEQNDFLKFCNSVKDMSKEELNERLKGTQEEQWLKNSAAVHKSGLLQRISNRRMRNEP